MKLGEIAIFSNTWTPNTKKKQGNTTPKRQQNKSLEINLKEIELYELHDRIQINHHENAF